MLYLKGPVIMEYTIQHRAIEFCVAVQQHL